jgi:cytoskeletal protein CcmA (bactofilin family)
MEPDKTTVIDAQSEIQGKLTGRDARVLGCFRGEIEISGRFIGGEGSKVEARLHADAAEIAGEFLGEIRVRALLLTEKARVEGTIQAELIAVREGAFLQAEVNAGPSGRPAELRPAIASGPRATLKGAAAS